MKEFQPRPLHELVAERAAREAAGARERLAGLDVAILDLDLPDGNGNLEVVAGSLVTLQAAADRPLARAWIEYQPDPKYADLSAFLGPLGQRQPVIAGSLAAAGQRPRRWKSARRGV